MNVSLSKGESYSLSFRDFTNDDLFIQCAGGNSITLHTLSFAGTPPKRGKDPRHFLQISGLQGSKPTNCIVALDIQKIYCESKNKLVEDMVNFISLVASPESVPIQGVSCIGPTTKAGGGILLDRGCVGLILDGCYVKGTNNYGIGIAGGRDNLVRNSRAVNCVNAGFYCHNYYPKDKFSGNKIDDANCHAVRCHPGFWIA
jgi:hypothetical protein